MPGCRRCDSDAAPKNYGFCNACRGSSAERSSTECKSCGEAVEPNNYGFCNACRPAVGRGGSSPGNPKPPAGRSPSPSPSRRKPATPRSPSVSKPEPAAGAGSPPPSTLAVLLYVPNLIGYARLLLIAAAFHIPGLYAEKPSAFLGLYALSAVLDGVDGLAARRLNQVWCPESESTRDPVPALYGKTQLNGTRITIRYSWVCPGQPGGVWGGNPIEKAGLADWLPRPTSAIFVCWVRPAHVWKRLEL